MRNWRMEDRRKVMDVVERWIDDWFGGWECAELEDGEMET